MLRIIIVCIALLAGGCAHSGRSTTPAASSREIQVRLDLAESYLAGGNPRLALQELLRIESDAGNVPRYGFDLGMAYLAVNETELAEKAMAQAVALDPEYGQAWNNLGRIKEALGDEEGAAGAYEQALSILTYRTPEFAAYNLARLFKKQGRVPEAVRYGEMAVDKNWRYSPGYQLLAELALENDDALGAQKWLEKGTAADMNDPDLLLALGENLVRLNRGVEAEKPFRRIIKEHPGTEQAQTAIQYLHMLQ